MAIHSDEFDEDTPFEEDPYFDDDPNYEGSDPDNPERLQTPGFWLPDEEGFELESETEEVEDEDEDEDEYIGHSLKSSASEERQEARDNARNLAIVEGFRKLSQEAVKRLNPVSEEDFKPDRPWEKPFPFSKVSEPASGRKPQVPQPIHAGEPWTRLLDEELTARFLSGESTQAIAAALGRTDGSVRSRVTKLFLHLQGFAVGKRFGIPRSAVTAAQLASIIQLRLQGMLTQDIAEDLNLEEEIVAGALLHARLLEPVDLDEVSYKDTPRPSTDSVRDSNHEGKAHRNQFKRWLPEDDKKLLSLWQSDVSMPELLDEIGRSQLGVLYRLIALKAISESDVNHFLEIKREKKQPPTRPTPEPLSNEPELTPQPPSSSRNHNLTLQDLLGVFFGWEEKIETGNSPRFNEPGWYYQGRTNLQCLQCAQVKYEVFRKPYKTAKGNYEYWGIACTECLSCTGLDVFDAPMQKLFRDWAKSIVRKPEIDTGSHPE